jgi:hypothetical protein
MNETVKLASGVVIVWVAMTCSGVGLLHTMKDIVNGVAS